MLARPYDPPPHPGPTQTYMAQARAPPRSPPDLCSAAPRYCARPAPTRCEARAVKLARWTAAPPLPLALDPPAPTSVAMASALAVKLAQAPSSAVAPTSSTHPLLPFLALHFESASDYHHHRDVVDPSRRCSPAVQRRRRGRGARRLPPGQQGELQGRSQGRRHTKAGIPRKYQTLARRFTGTLT